MVRFCARRVPPERAEDVAAEAMSIAWRRVADLRAWLFTTARRPG